MEEMRESPESTYSLKYLIKTKVYILSRTWPARVILTKSYAKLYQFIELYEQLFLSSFTVDMLFSTRFTFRVKQYEQILL